MGAEVELGVTIPAGLSLVREDIRGPQGGGDMTALSLNASCFLQLSAFIHTAINDIQFTYE